jgi:hypothetical protein
MRRLEGIAAAGGDAAPGDVTELYVDVLILMMEDLARLRKNGDVERFMNSKKAIDELQIDILKRVKADLDQLRENGDVERFESLSKAIDVFQKNLPPGKG